MVKGPRGKTDKGLNWMPGNRLAENSEANLGGVVESHHRAGTDFVSHRLSDHG